MSVIVGLDLSLTSPGIAVIKNGKIAKVSNTKTTGKKQASLKYPEGSMTADRHSRMDGLTAWVWDETQEFFFHDEDGISLVVIEAPAVGSRLGSMHDRSGFWWGVVSMFLSHSIPVTEVSPAGRQKYITGTGRSGLGKAVVLAHAIERYAEHVPGGKIKNDDIADALGLADMGARRLGCPVVPDALMPEANLAAMDGVLWTA